VIKTIEIEGFKSLEKVRLELGGLNLFIGANASGKSNVDADGKDRRGEFEALEREAADQGVRLVCCAAQQEVEVWLLAGHRGKLGAGWHEIRAEVSVKERFFEPFLRENGNQKAAGGGREELMKKTLGNYTALLQLCPELAVLEQRIR
jgi:hypothetical protein